MERSSEEKTTFLRLIDGEKMMMKLQLLFNVVHVEIKPTTVQHIGGTVA